MKTCGGVEVYHHEYITGALDIKKTLVKVTVQPIYLWTRTHDTGWVRGKSQGLFGCEEETILELDGNGPRIFRVPVRNLVMLVRFC